jgi:hypothetical protein
MNGWRTIFMGLFVVAFAVLGHPSCPVDSVATDSEVLAGAFGTVIVEVCVTRSGLQDTYTYRLTYLGGGAARPCGLVVSGAGKLDTVSMSAPRGWRTSISDTSDCATWWSWSDSLLGRDLGTLPIGRTLVASVTVEGGTATADLPALLSFCGKEQIPFSILGPSQSGVAAPFVGTGARIYALVAGGAQTIAQCEPSWVRHGFIGDSLDPDSVLFRLLVDGVEVALNREILCMPSTEVGLELTQVLWYQQFPADYFAAGVHEVTGVWEGSAAAFPPDGYVWDQTFDLHVEACAPEPIPLPDLKTRIDDVKCACDWSPRQEYRCTLTVAVTITNDGTADSSMAWLAVSAGTSRAVEVIPALAPGQAYSKDVKIVIDDVTYGREPCRFDVTATADLMDQSGELDEQNNSDQYEACCK